MIKSTAETVTTDTPDAITIKAINEVKADRAFFQCVTILDFNIMFFARAKEVYDDWTEDYTYCKVVDKNGKCVFKGEMSHLFDRFKQPNQRKLLTPSYAENYLSSNLAQIHNRMWNPKK